MSQSAQKLAHQPASNKRVLLVEDNPVNQKVALGLLLHLGYCGDLAKNGAEALVLIQRSVKHGVENRYAAILMDLQMPVMDGLTATHAIRNLDGESSGIPIIALTANAFDGERQKCLAAGMNDFLTKPINKDKFAAALERWTSQPARREKRTP